MDQKRKELLRKIVLLTVLIMIAVGFTIPAALQLGGEESSFAEPRICQNDAECYLMCNDLPVKVLCSANLCQQNSCTEQSYYAFNSTPVNFKLAVEQSGKKINLDNRTNAQDIFIKFNGDNVQVFSSRIILKQILEKVGFTNNDFTLTVNGEQSYSYENYLPEEGNVLKVVYK